MLFVLVGHHWRYCNSCSKHKGDRATSHRTNQLLHPPSHLLSYSSCLLCALSCFSSAPLRWLLAVISPPRGVSAATSATPESTCPEGPANAAECGRAQADRSK